jgi:hypothetical protein
MTFFVAEKTKGDIKRRRILAMVTDKDCDIFCLQKKLLAIFQHNKMMGYNIRG